MVASKIVSLGVGGCIGYLFCNCERLDSVIDVVRKEAENCDCLQAKNGYMSTPKTEKFSEDGENGRIIYGLSSMQGWRATMEDAHAAYPDLDASTSFFGVYDGLGGKVVAKFCAKYLHQQVLKHETYSNWKTSLEQLKSICLMQYPLHVYIFPFRETYYLF
ncbi:putative protein phosphatase 2C 21 [Camellia lanceoleosa]|uniref:Uncharacterized protein n=1 Tax=Camellia lanceoleosa TaxID=1840588 RepID=A0ACC0IAV5_9ERIC|nr:putative protein phosphatase 2C 21 [Camellia lanceoleosa]